MKNCLKEWMSQVWPLILTCSCHLDPAVRLALFKNNENKYLHVKPPRKTQPINAGYFEGMNKYFTFYMCKRIDLVMSFRQAYLKCKIICTNRRWQEFKVLICSWVAQVAAVKHLNFKSLGRAGRLVGEILEISSLWTGA